MFYSLADFVVHVVASVDCMGILKLRNADVEQRIGLAKSKKKSTSARLIFRCNVPRSDGSLQTLQIPSTPIICSKFHLYLNCFL